MLVRANCYNMKLWHMIDFQHIFVDTIVSETHGSHAGSQDSDG
jgi:hypothetical protein